MAVKTFIGDANGIAREIKKLYIGDSNNIAREIKTLYAGDSGGIARKIFGATSGGMAWETLNIPSSLITSPTCKFIMANGTNLSVINTGQSRVFYTNYYPISSWDYRPTEFNSCTADLTKYGPNYVAIGNTSFCIYSTDYGQLFIQGYMPSTQNWTAVTKTPGGIFIAVCRENYAAYSPGSSTATPGRDWKLSSAMPSLSAWYKVVASDSIAVAFNPPYSSGLAYCAYSTDSGKTWTQFTLSNAISFKDFAYSKTLNMFVAIQSSGGTAMYSKNGIDWKTTDFPNLSYNNWQRVAAGDDKFVAVSRLTDVFAYSEDGITWKEGKLPKSAGWADVAYNGNGTFFALADDGTIAYGS